MLCHDHTSIPVGVIQLPFDPSPCHRHLRFPFAQSRTGPYFTTLSFFTLLGCGEQGQKDLFIFNLTPKHLSPHFVLKHLDI